MCGRNCSMQLTDDPCVFVVFLSGQVEGTVTSAEKLEVTGVSDAFLSGPDE